MNAASAHCQKPGLMETSPAFSFGHLAMAIIGIILAALAGIGVWYYRVKMLGEMGSDIADLAGRARGAYRMNRFKKQADAATLNAVDDPALAAAIFLYALANEDKASLFKSEPEIRRVMTPVVRNELDELLGYAQWAAREVLDPRDLVRRFKPLWREHLTVTERQQFVGMAETVLSQSAAPEPAQLQIIDMLRGALIP
jgi:uncharacterized tellurite resistance protein B-like protein